MVRNEILLGVSIVRAVPDEHNRLELMAMTQYIHSLVMPLILRENAGVKGSVNFVRDVCALT